MKSIAALILLMALMAQLGSRFIVLLNYEANKNYIAKNLCVNRTKPASGCNGKCYLKKQLAKAANEENRAAGNTGADKNDIFLIAKAPKTITCLTIEENSRQYLHPKQSFTFQSCYGPVFHPPQAT